MPVIEFVRIEFSKFHLSDKFRGLATRVIADTCVSLSRRIAAGASGRVSQSALQRHRSAKDARRRYDTGETLHRQSLN